MKISDKDLINMYIDQKFSIRKIAKLNPGTYCGYISKKLKEMGISIRGRNGIDFPKNTKSCSVCGDIGRTSSIDKTLYCKKHYNQMKTRGEILKRTKYDKNEIIEKEDVAEIIICDALSNEICRAIIDVEDVPKVLNTKWHYAQGYAKSTDLGFLHNVILNREPNKKDVVDHISRNRLDCRKSNLRITTFQENGINKGKQSNNTSGFPGVSWDKYHGKYEASIKINQKKIFLGYFDNIDNAIQKRKEAEVVYFGEEVNRENDINTVFKKDNK